jgi:hypothetical protein
MNRTAAAYLLADGSFFTDLGADEMLPKRLFHNVSLFGFCSLLFEHCKSFKGFAVDIPTCLVRAADYPKTAQRGRIIAKQVTCSLDARRSRPSTIAYSSDCMHLPDTGTN